MSTEVELKLTADAASATREIAGFRKEYADLVRAIEKPLRQIDVLQKTQESAKAASSEFFAAKRQVESLKAAIADAGQPVKALDQELAKAERTLARTSRAFEVQKQRVKEQRAELKAAGVDYRNLAAEQQRLQAAAGAVIGKGRADAAVTRSLDTFGITKLRELRAQLVTLRSDYARLAQSGVASATERAAAEIQYRAQLGRTQAAIRELTIQQKGSGTDFAGMTARLASVVAAAYSVQRVAGAYFAIADAVGTLEDRMRNALPVQKEYEDAQARLEEIALRVRAPIEQTTELYLGTVGPLREMGYSYRDAADMVGALSAGLVANGVKGQQAEAVINQISKGLQTGVIRGEAFNAVIRNSPALTDALIKGLGVTRAELFRMAAAGELTTEKFVTALSSQSEALLGLTDNMRNTWQDAVTTFQNSVGNIVAAIDGLTGLSTRAVKELDKVSAALNGLANGSAIDLLKLLEGSGGTFERALNPMTTVRQIGASRILQLVETYNHWRDVAVDTTNEVTEASLAGAETAKQIEDDRLANMRSYATQFGGIQKQLAIDFKKALDDQIAAQAKAKTKLEKARSAQLETEKRYKDALQKLNAGVGGEASFSNAQALKAQARQAMQAKNADEAKKKAQAALAVLMDLQAAGANTYGFEGMIKELLGIEQAADQINVDKAKDSFEEAREKTRVWKLELEELKNFKISPTVDDEGLAKATDKLRNWSKMIGKEIQLDQRVLPATPAQAAESWGKGVADKALVDAGLKPSAPASSQPSPVAIQPVSVKQPGADLPAVDVEIAPKGVRQDGANSFTNLPPVDVEVRPRGIRQDGENSFTNLPPVDLEVEVDQQSVAAAERIVSELAANATNALKVSMLIQPTVAGGGASAPGFANGGWTGPGSKYQPAGIVHADEHVQPARVVNEPGALPFLEQIRRNGFQNTMRSLRGYAEGGLVAPPRLLPDIPSPSPELLARAQAPALGDYGTVNFQFPGAAPMQVLATPDTATELRRLALKFARTHS